MRWRVLKKCFKIVFFLRFYFIYYNFDCLFITIVDFRYFVIVLSSELDQINMGPPLRYPLPNKQRIIEIGPRDKKFSLNIHKTNK